MNSKRRVPADPASRKVSEEIAKVSGTAPQSPKSVPPSRNGKVAINSWHDPAVATQLKMLAAEQRTTQQKLIEDGLNAVFKKYGKPEIA
jgi:hypothetical protein